MSSVKQESDQGTKKILLIGSGFVAQPCVEYLVRSPLNRLTVASRNLAAAQKLSTNLQNTTAISLDVLNTSSLESQIASHDLVISLIPYTYHPAVIKAAIKGRTHVVTTSYVSPAMRELEREAKEAGIVVFNEVGLDPGIDHLYAIKTIEEVHEKKGKITQFHSYCGAMPAPECADNPLKSKFSWSPRGFLQTHLNNASFLSDSKKVDIPGPELMNHVKPYAIPPKWDFMAFPNRDSTPFREFYGIPEARSVIRGSLRYKGFVEFVKVLAAMGWLDAASKPWLEDSLTWGEVTQRLTGADESVESALITQINKLCNFPDADESERVISGLRWIGLFSESKVTVRNGNPLDTLCAQLEKLMTYKPGERDLIVLQHKFYIEWEDGKQEIRTSTLEMYGEPNGHSAMALTVGIPCGIASQLVLDGRLGEPGVHAPYSREVCDLLRKEVEKEGIVLVERTLD